MTAEPAWLREAPPIDDIEPDILAAQVEANNRPPATRLRLMPATTGGPAAGLRFYSPLELASLTTAGPDWRLRPFLAIGAITEIDGKIKAARG
jgi:hypothetical protein